MLVLGSNFGAWRAGYIQNNLNMSDKSYYRTYDIGVINVTSDRNPNTVYGVVSTV